MSGIEMVHRAQHDVDQLQSALTRVQTGLDTVELAAETVDTARRGFRRLVKLTLALTIIGAVIVVATIARSRMGPSEDDTTD